MEEFLAKISILKDVLAATGERLKDSEIILDTLGALGNGYESFVTSVTTHFDPEMTFASLCELLMDHEIRSQQNQSIFNQPSVNIAIKDSPKLGEDNLSKSELKYQICSRKSHSTVNCYNRLNLTKYPPSHTRELSSFGPTVANRQTTHSLNLMMMWYPDSGASSHITATSGNVQQPRAFSSNDCVLITDGSPLAISSCG